MSFVTCSVFQDAHEFFIATLDLLHRHLIYKTGLNCCKTKAKILMLVLQALFPPPAPALWTQYSQENSSQMLCVRLEKNVHVHMLILVYPFSGV